MSRFAVGAMLAAGCQALPEKTGVAADTPPPVARPQAPVEGTPVEPAGTTPGYPVAPAAVIPTAPPETGTASATPASFSVPLAPAAGALREFLLNDKPRVKVVAVVGKGNIVTDEEVWQSVRQRPDHRDALAASDRETREAEMYRYELKRIIERELLIDDMLAKMKKGKPGAIDDIKDYAARAAERHIRTARRRYNFATDEEFEKKALAPQGLTVNVLRRQIERNTISTEYIRSMVREKVKGIGLGDIHEFYVKNPEKFHTKDRAKWLDIFVPFALFATPQEAYRHAETVRQQAANGADFLALVKEHDKGDATFRNGEGLGQLPGEIRPAELEPVVFQTQAGQVAPLAQTATGYHIIKVVERESAATKPFDEKTQTAIREMLFEQMQEQEYARLTENLWRNGAVQVLDVP